MAQVGVLQDTPAVLQEMAVRMDALEERLNRQQEVVDAAAKILGLASINEASEAELLGVEAAQN